MGSKGYKYFGVAKDLPGVKEMFQSKASVIMKRGRDVVKIVDGAYFGIGEEEDEKATNSESSDEPVAEDDWSRESQVLEGKEVCVCTFF